MCKLVRTSVTGVSTTEFLKITDQWERSRNCISRSWELNTNCVWKLWCQRTYLNSTKITRI